MSKEDICISNLIHIYHNVPNEHIDAVTNMSAAIIEHEAYGKP